MRAGVHGVLRLGALAIVVTACAWASVRVEAQAGWRELDLGGGHRAVRFLPSGVRACDPLPLLLFLHGAGGTPDAYESQLDTHAEALGLVLLLPQSTGTGWSDADVTVLNDALDAIGVEVNVDDTRSYLGGHSAGGAFSYLLTYDGTGIAAVFSMSAPFYMVSGLGEPSYPAPIHMYYGDMDPNYTGGSAAALASQWDRLGVPHETDVQAGYAHSTWPASSIRAGFDFLLAHRHPGASPPSRCGDADAASSALDAATSPADAAAIDLDASGLDAATTPTDAATTDAYARNVDAGRSRAIASGCGCRAGSHRRSLAIPWALALAGALWSRARRARTVRR
ncbi:MAG: hypothetical protein U0353_34450 [Sandaracinus sp.]